MDFRGTGGAHHFYDFPACRTPDNRVVDEHHALAREQIFDGIQFHFDTEMANLDFRLDKCAAHVMISNQSEREWNSRLLRVSNGSRYAGVGNGNNEISIHRTLLRQNSAHQIAACLYGSSKDNAVGTREIHVLENAFRQPRRRQRLDGFQFTAADQHNFTRFHFAKIRGSDQIERAGLRFSGLKPLGSRTPMRLSAVSNSSEKAPCT